MRATISLLINHMESGIISSTPVNCVKSIICTSVIHDNNLIFRAFLLF